jgi:hypothetical protein
MASIFDLKTNVQELSSANEGTSRMSYEQHPPTRDVTGNNFPNGAQHIRWQNAGQKWWVPSRTYIRLRGQLSRANGDPLLVGDDVAPNMGLMANLYQSMEFRINDKTVSRISDYVPQIDALETRLSKSKAWLEGVGNSTNWWQAETKERMAEATGNGVLIDKVIVADSVNTRPGDGYDVAGGAQDERNQIDYVAATGLCTFLQGTDLNGLVNLDPFRVGDFLEFTTSDVGDLPGSLTSAQINIRCKVLTKPSPTTMTVENLIVGNLISDGRNNWRRISQSEGLDEARRLKTFEMTWQPPLSIFKVGHALPSGRYELVLNPQTSSQFRKRAIESLLADKNPSPDAVVRADQFKFEVVDMYLYTATVDGPRADDITYLLDLEQTRCQVDVVGTGDFTQKNFDVSPSTYALTTAFQDQRAGNNTLYSASKFKIGAEAEDELKLNRLFINYAGQNRPQPDADPTFVANNDYTVQRYVDSQLYSGAYFDTGGAETIKEFHERGSYYYFSWPRDGTDRSTRVNVHFGFTGAIANGRVLLFDHSKQVARVRVQDGHVVDVQVEDA